MFKKDSKECNKKIQQWQEGCRSSIFNNSTIDSCAELQKEGRSMFSSTTIDKRYPPEELPSAKYMREHQKDWEERDKKIQQWQKESRLPIALFAEIREQVKETKTLLEEYKQMKKEYIDFLRNRWI